MLYRNLDVLCHLVWGNVATFCVGVLTKTATALLLLLHEQLEWAKSYHVMSLSLSVSVKCIQLNNGVCVQYFGKSMSGRKDVS